MHKDLWQLLGWAGPLTHRQYRGWAAWRRAEWNNPSRADYYLMQVAARVAGTDVETQRIGFNFGTPEPLTQEEATLQSEARWFAALGNASNKPIQGIEQSEWHQQQNSKP